MTSAQAQNVARQEAAKSAMAAAQARCNAAMWANDESARKAANPDMQAAAAEWNEACKEAVETRWV